MNFLIVNYIYNNTCNNAYIFRYIFTYRFACRIRCIFACLFILIFRCIFIFKSTCIIDIKYVGNTAETCAGSMCKSVGIYACMSTHILFVTIPVLIISYDTISERYYFVTSRILIVSLEIISSDTIKAPPPPKKIPHH